ncbi:MAG: EamA family transporter, partial [Candidatus Nanohaloarchaea archaeon]
QEVSRPSVSAYLNKIPNFLVFTAVGLIQADIAFSPRMFLTGTVLSSLYIVSSYFYYVGIGQEDVSRFIPTLSISTVFVVIISFLILGEKFGVTEYAGILMTVGGAILISMEKPSRGIHIFQSRKAILVGVIAAFLWAVRDVILKLGTSSVDIFQLLFWIGISGLMISVLGSGFIYSRMERKSLKGYEHLLLIGSMVAVGYLTFIKSISLGPVSLASVVVKIDAALVFLGSILISKFHPENNT